MAKKTIWIGIEHATREQMEISFAQKRAAIASELGQMAIDCAAFNQNWNKGAPIVVVMDFRDDVEEFAMLTNHERRQRARDSVTFPWERE